MRSAFILSSITEFDLSDRAKNALRNARIGTGGELIRKTEVELLRLNNFGRKSLDEIRDLTSYYGLELGRQAEKTIKLTEDRRVQIISQSNFRRFFPDLMGNEGCDLAVELRLIAHNWGGERNADIICSLNGWEGEQPTVLESTGQRFGLTRERVRQINEKFWDRVKACRITPPSLSEAALHLESSFYLHGGELVHLPEENGKVQTPLTAESIWLACKNFGLDVSFSVGPIGTFRHVICRPELLEASERISTKAKRLVSSRGAVSVGQLIDVYLPEIEIQASAEECRMIIDSIETSEWLDAEREWFWFAGAMRNRLKNVLQKIFSLANEITGSELRTGLRNETRLEGSCPPISVLAALCDRFDFVEYKQGRFYSKIYGSHDVVLSGVQLKMVEILIENDGYMDRNDFIEECCARGINYNSIAAIYLTYAVFESFGFGIISLIGTNIPTFAVETARKRYARKARVIEDYGWAPGGKIYLLAQLSKSAAISGLLNVPGSIAEFVGTEYSIGFPETEVTFKLNVVQNIINGLQPVFRHCGVEAGDHILLLFDAQSKHAKLHIGSRDAMEVALNFS